MNPLRNVAVVIGPDGGLLAEYEKRYPVPGIEAEYGIGTGPRFFKAADAAWGVAICKDLDFPSWLHKYGRGGARILAVPAWDLFGDARLHSRMAVVRGVEKGSAIARAANGGFITFSDAYGGIIGEDASSRTPEALLIRNISLGPGQTLYSSLGNWFRWLCLAAAVPLLRFIFKSRRRGNHVP